MSEAQTLTVAPRFCGPPGSANGGYFAGRVAGLANTGVKVRLRRPPPLGVAMGVECGADGHILVHHDGQTIAEAFPEGLALEVPAPPSALEVVEATRRFAGWQQHVFPGCFVCGPRRARRDGLRIFPGEVRRVEGWPIVAAPWVPDASLALPDGSVAPPFIWAALDCPGYFALDPGERVMLLAEQAARIWRPLRVDEPVVVIGWRIGGEGRVHEAGTALFGADGELCAQARALWIEPRRESVQPAVRGG